MCIRDRYNRAALVEKTIESIVSQLGADGAAELIVSDDASSDRTREVVEKYLPRSPMIRYLHNTSNLGYQKNVLTAAEAAKGCLLYTSRCV